MSGDFAPINLTNHFLIAMPALADALFSRSVVYVCQHSPSGALGLVINKPADISMTKLFDKVELPLNRADLADAPVFHGGPLQEERGFVLHDASASCSVEDSKDLPATQMPYASSMAISGGLTMTTSKDVLQALSEGGGPHKVLVSLGYASWGEGQLETELGANSWLTVDANRDLIFDTPVAQRYDKALALLGLQAWMISSQVGHA
jgi:putative transcriptional regulator